MKTRHENHLYLLQVRSGAARRCHWRFVVAMLAALVWCLPVEGRGASTVKAPRCLSSAVELNRSWEEERNADINQEFNDYAAVYLDSMSADCKELAAAILEGKVSGTLEFARAGGLVAGPHGLEVHPFQNWLWGVAVTHIFAAALELQHNGLAVSQELLTRARDSFSEIADTQDPTCADPANGCLDDLVLTASGFAWIAAWERRSGNDPLPNVLRASRVLGRAFQPLAQGGGICYYAEGSEPVRCDGDPAGLAAGSTKIIGIGHGQENPNYGVGLMTGVASACLGLYLAGRPCDFGRTDPHTGLTWKQISVGLLNHGLSKTDGANRSFAGNCVSITQPGTRVTCADSFGYTPDLYPLSRFYAFKVGYLLGDSPADHFTFDRFDPNYESRQAEGMYDRRSFWGLNRFVFYKLFAHDAWPGGALNRHFYYIYLAGSQGL